MRPRKRSTTIRGDIECDWGNDANVLQQIKQLRRERKQEIKRKI